MFKRALMVFISLVFIYPYTSWADLENLDEKMARKSRYTTASWGKAYLEDPNTYIWQPESLCYADVTTGHEVWVLFHGPDEQAIYSNEYATNAWSYDGSTLGVWVRRTERGTNNPECPSDGNSDCMYRRWLVKSDGSYLKAAEGYAHTDWPEGGFGWAHTENAYYGFGSGSWEGASTWELCKMAVNNQNVVDGSVILNTATATNGDRSKGVNSIKKGIIKKPISGDDEWLSCSARASQDYGRSINCYGHMRIHLNKGVNPTISDYWGINRNIYEYADHSQSHEYKAHGGGNWAYGLQQEYSHMLYTGSEHIFFQMKTRGTDIDGGPKWENWDGDSYGANDIVPISSAIIRPPNPEGFFHDYWGHPSIDRWEKYIMWGDTGDLAPGTRVTLVKEPGTGFNGDEGHVTDGLSTHAQYDGRHHAWDGWTDHVVFFPYYVGDAINGYHVMYGRKIHFNNGTLGNAYPIVTTHLEYSGNYNAYPRPSQSPDGTKVAFQAHWLNNDGDDYPYLSYAVAYYPYPPEISRATASGGVVNIRFDWRLDQGNPRGYTKRGWPDEATDNPPPPREIAKFRLWRSNDKGGWTPIIETVDADMSTKYDFATSQWYSGQTSYWEITDTPGDGTFYYAVTAVEHSGLESHTLSNIYKITLSDGSGSGSEDTAYPSNPGADSRFYTKPPSPPLNVTQTYRKSPATASGQYTIEWSGPADYEIIRYFNIYAKDGEVPQPIQQNLIASIPARAAQNGSFSWVDCFGNSNESTLYLVTSVDYQGNESAGVADPNNESDTQDRLSPPSNFRVVEVE